MFTKCKISEKNCGGSFLGLPRRQQGLHRHSGPHGEHGERLLADGVAGGVARHRHDHQAEGEERGNPNKRSTIPSSSIHLVPYQTMKR